MQDRNVIAGATAAVISPLVDFYSKLLPFLMLAIALIVIDSRFGILASRKRGETIRASRAVRRAINKLVDYICWVTLAGMIGQTFGTAFHIPLLSLPFHRGLYCHGYILPWHIRTKSPPS